MHNTDTFDHANATQHSLTIADLRNIDNLTEDIMFNLTPEEFEDMMNQIDSSACIEPPYFPTLTTELEPQNLSYY